MDMLLEQNLFVCRGLIVPKVYKELLKLNNSKKY